MMRILPPVCHGDRSLICNVPMVCCVLLQYREGSQQQLLEEDVSPPSSGRPATTRDLEYSMERIRRWITPTIETCRSQPIVAATSSCALGLLGRSFRAATVQGGVTFEVGDYLSVSHTCLTSLFLLHDNGLSCYPVETLAVYMRTTECAVSDPPLATLLSHPRHFVPQEPAGSSHRYVLERLSTSGFDS